MSRVLLLSGGMDSTAIAWWLRPEHSITIDYGQLPAAAEIGAAATVAKAMGISHQVLRIDLTAVGSGDLAGRPPADIAPVPEWWPFRNQMVITLAGMYAVRVGASEILLGTVGSDSVHADGRREFVEMMSSVMSFQEGGIRLSAPAVDLSATELIVRSGAPRELLAWAHSCHVHNVACGACRGCVKHFETWSALGWPAH